MSLKPIDAQINILQMNNAAKEISKGKNIEQEKQHFAASLVEKEGVEKSKKVEEPEKVESTMAPLENEIKDERHKDEKNQKSEHEKKSKEEKEKTKLFQDPSKGVFIDIKE